MSRYAEAEWRPMPGAGTYTGGPKRLVLHTTEGASLAGAEAAYKAKAIAPHFTVEPATKRWAQHIDTASSASAMANLSGGVQTNRDGAIQIEIVGYAANTQNLTDDVLKWLGGIVRLVCEREGIDVTKYPRFVGTESGTIATTTAPQRMSFAAWENFNGVCGHQHVPENHHWDPGRFPYDRMLALSSPTKESDDVRIICKGDQTVNWWITDGITKEYIESPDIGGGLVWIGLAKWDPAGGPLTVGQAWIDSIPVQPKVVPIPTPAEIAKAVVEALPPASSGGLTAAQVQAATEAAIVAKLGPVFDGL